MRSKSGCRISARQRSCRHGRLSSGVDAGQIQSGWVCSRTQESVFLKENAPARGIDSHGEVRKNAGAQETGFTREELSCVKAGLHAADPVFGKIDNCLDISDRSTREAD